MMDLAIRRLTPELLNDYLYFFDNVAFSDHPGWAQCYCIHFHWQSKWDDEPPKNNRDRVIEHINHGLIQGYLAYSGGQVVGWCNVNDKQRYAALKYNINAALRTDDEDKKIKSVVCFLVAPEMRGRGIATKMLERVCDDAKADGYEFLEGYPPAGHCDMYAAHHGTISLFGKCGFAIHKQLDHGCVMRKLLIRRTIT